MDEEYNDKEKSMAVAWNKTFRKHHGQIILRLRLSLIMEISLNIYNNSDFIMSWSLKDGYELAIIDLDITKGPKYVLVVENPATGI